MAQKTIYVTKNGTSLSGYDEDKYKRNKSNIEKSGYRVATEKEIEAWLKKKGYAPAAKSAPKPEPAQTANSQNS